MGVDCSVDEAKIEMNKGNLYLGIDCGWEQRFSYRREGNKEMMLK